MSPALVTGSSTEDSSPRGWSAPTWWEDQRQQPVRWDDGEEASGQATAWSLLDLYLRQTPIPPNEMPEAVEVSVEVDLSQQGLPKLIGILDLVRAGGGVVNYRTVDQTPTDEKVSVHGPERFLMLGFVEALPKPVAIDKLRAAVRHALAASCPRSPPRRPELRGFAQPERCSRCLGGTGHRPVAAGDPPAAHRAPEVRQTIRWFTVPERSDDLRQPD